MRGELLQLRRYDVRMFLRQGHSFCRINIRSLLKTISRGTELRGGEQCINTLFAVRGAGQTPGRNWLEEGGRRDAALNIPTTSSMAGLGMLKQINTVTVGNVVNCLFFAGLVVLRLKIFVKALAKGRLGGAVIITLEETMAMRRKEVWCCLFQIIFFLLVSCFLLVSSLPAFRKCGWLYAKGTKHGSYGF
jgi:hypothetical protein